MKLKNFLKQTKRDRAKIGIEPKKIMKLNNGSQQRLKVFVKKNLIPLIIGFIFMGLIIILSPYIFRSWTKYPQALRAEIAWRKFSASFNGICRESCLASRQSYANIWRPIFLKDTELQRIKLEEVFESDNNELQKAMIKIMAADLKTTDLPPIFARLLMDESVSEENKRLIVMFFPNAFNNPNWLAQLRSTISNYRLTVAERAYALSLLAPFPERENISLVKRIILEENDSGLIAQAFKVVSVWPNGSLALTAADLNELKEMIVKSPFKQLRWRRIWLLSELDSGLATDREEILREIAYNASLDNISRGLAAEALRLEFSLEINTPEPSAPEWQELYEYL